MKPRILLLSFLIIVWKKIEDIFSDMEFGVLDEWKITFVSVNKVAISHLIRISKQDEIILISGKRQGT